MTPFKKQKTKSDLDNTMEYSQNSIGLDSQPLSAMPSKDILDHQIQQPKKPEYQRKENLGNVLGAAKDYLKIPQQIELKHASLSSSVNRDGFIQLNSIQTRHESSRREQPMMLSTNKKNVARLYEETEMSKNLGYLLGETPGRPNERYQDNYEQLETTFSEISEDSLFSIRKYESNIRGGRKRVFKDS
jgi:hypothetical protein